MDSEYYRTTSFYTAAILMHAGHRPTIETRPDSYLRYFRFPKTDDILRIVAEFDSAGPYQIDIKEFIPVFRELRDLMYQNPAPGREPENN